MGAIHRSIHGEDRSIHDVDRILDKVHSLPTSTSEGLEMTAFEKGFKAYKEGWSHQENPYAEDSDNNSEWQIGWNQANYDSWNID